MGGPCGQVVKTVTAVTLNCLNAHRYGLSLVHVLVAGGRAGFPRGSPV